MSRSGPRTLVLAAAVAFAGAVPVRAAENPSTPSPPLRVLIVGSFGEHFEPFRTAATRFRNRLALELPRAVEFYDVSLETARYDDDAADAAFVDYLHALLASRPPDLVVPVGSPAVLFCARQRAVLFPDVSILVYAVEERRLAGVDVGANAATVGLRVDDHGFMTDLLHLFPATKRVYVVLGASPLERFWTTEMTREWEPFANKVEFAWLGGSTFSEIGEQVANLPPHSVIVFGLMNVDAAGIPHEQRAALERIHRVANAPVFGFFSHELGSGIVGGRLVDLEAMAAEAVRAAVRILGGEPAARIPPRFVGPGAPRFDARELRRWHLDEDRLPAGSAVAFRQKTLWESYWVYIVSAGAFVLLQGATIVLLLVHRSRLRAAQRELDTSHERLDMAGRQQRQAVAEAQEMRRQLTHSGRVSLMGQLMASVSHELGQPLGAILRNVDAAELIFKSDSPDLEEIRAILTDIRRDDERASALIQHLRSLLSRRPVDMQPHDLSQVVADVMKMVRADTESRRIQVEVDVPRELPPVRGDRLHLQQVLINLLVNAMDAVDTDGFPRCVRLSAQHRADGTVEVSVRDRGLGIPRDALTGIFDPFVSTKSDGMGMGLPISRSIVEAHGGRIWAENHPGGGAAFNFTIPVADGAKA